MQLILLCFLLPIALGSAIPGQEKCVWGPPYWCSSIVHARECGATQHCLQTIWKNQIIKPESTATCTYCEVIVNAFRDALENKATQAQVAAVLTNVCAILPSHDTRDMCQEIVLEYVPELVQMFEDDITTDMICATLDLCSGLEDRWSPYGVKAGNGSVCNDCMRFFKDVQDSITSKETVNQLLQLLNQTICSQLGAFSDTCLGVFKQYLPVALQTLADQIAPDIVCRVFGFCTSDGVQGDVIKMKNIFSERTSKGGLVYRSNEECDVCQAFVTEVDTMMKDPSEQDKLINEIKFVFCPKMGDFVIQCRQFTMTYAPGLLKLLGNKLQMDPLLTCKVAGLCPNTKVDLIQRIKSMLTEIKSKVGDGLKASDEECDLCKEVVTQIDDLVKDKSNQDKFKYEFETYICPELGNLQDECKQLVEEYAPELFELIVNELDPKTLCERVGFCTVPSSPKVVLAKKLEPAGMVGSGYEEKSTECTLCTFIMQEVDNLLKQNETLITVEDLLDKVCKKLPTGDLDKDCEGFVAQYGKKMLNLLSKENICEDIKVCPKTVAVSIQREQKASGATCQLCIVFVNMLEELLANVSKEEIMNDLRQFCGFIPGNYSSTCLLYVDEYASMVIELLKGHEDPTTVCQIAGACTGSLIPYMTKPIPENLPALKGPSKECEFCNTAVVVLKSYLANKATKAQLEEGLDALCTYIPYITPICQSVVAEYGDQIIALIDSELNATEICTKVGLCKAVKKQTPVLSAIMSPYDTLPLEKPLENKKATTKVSELCKICDTIVVFAKYALDNNATEEEVINAMKALCGELQSEISGECTVLVDTYGKVIIDYIKNNLNATKICQEVGACKAVKKPTSAVSVIMSPYDTLPLKKPLENKKVVKSSMKCDLCQKGISMMKAYIKENATKEEIEKVVESFCEKIPTAFEQECDGFIKQYGSEIINLLVNKADAHEICVKIGLCDEVLSIPEIMSPYDTHPIVQPVSEKKGSVSTGNDVECEACKSIMTYLEDELQQNATKEDIEAFLKDICSKLPDTLSTQCTNLVDEYEPAIIDFLLLSESPEKICKQLTLCTAGVKKLPEPVHVKLLKDSKETLKSTAGPSCEICEFVVREIDDILQGNNSKETIEKALVEVCSRLPDTINAECTNFVEKYSQVIISLLVQNLDPQKICTVINLCSKRMMSPLATRVKIVPEKAKALDKLKTVVTCELCEYAMNYLDSILEENSTEADIEAALEKLCGALPPTLTQQCDTFVEEYAAMAVKLILQDLSPKEVCSVIGLCSSGQKSKWGALVKILPEKIKALDKPKSSAECVLCEFVMKELDSILEKNSTSTEVEKALEKVCGELPSTLKSQCDAFVEEYAKLVVDLIAQGFSPDQICRDVKLCPSGQQSKWGTVVKILKEKNKALEKPKSSDYCAVCKLVMNELDSILEQNSTEIEIEEALEKVCSFLPSTLTGDCDEFVQTYTPQIVHLITTDVSPAQVCAALGLCSSRQQSKWGTLVNILQEKNKASDKLKSSIECEVCKEVISALKGLLKDNSSEAEIKAALKKVCSIMPSEITAQCDAFVDEYEPLVIGLIVQDMTPEKICATIKLCSSGKQSKWGTFVKILPKKSEELCVGCKLLVEQIQEFLNQSRTTKEVEDFMKNVCDLLPDTVTAQCEAVVDQYIPAILDLLRKNLNPEQICQKLELCNATLTHKNDADTLFYKPHRLGQNKCSYGPAYWCANKNNAAECNAMEHCRRHVWN